MKNVTNQIELACNAPDVLGTGARRILAAPIKLVHIVIRQKYIFENTRKIVSCVVYYMRIYGCSPQILADRFAPRKLGFLFDKVFLFL